MFAFWAVKLCYSLEQFASCMQDAYFCCFEFTTEWNTLFFFIQSATCCSLAHRIFVCWASEDKSCTKNKSSWISGYSYNRKCILMWIESDFNCFRVKTVAFTPSRIHVWLTVISAIFPTFCTIKCLCTKYAMKQLFIFYFTWNKPSNWFELLWVWHYESSFFYLHHIHFGTPYKMACVYVNNNSAFFLSRFFGIPKEWREFRSFYASLFK